MSATDIQNTPAPYTKGEELMHTLTHWIGTIIVSIGSGALITMAAVFGDVWQIVGVSVFSLSVITLYCASTLYHVAESPTAKRRLKIFDHISIYYLIAGTYTPFLLTNLRSKTGWIVLLCIWLVAFAGTVMKIFFTGRFKTFSVSLYLLMGWTVIFVAKPFIQNVPLTGIIFLAIGGLFYSGGVYFYVRKDKKYYHGIWHILVLIATIMHYFAILFSCITFPSKVI
ncbi:hemolysin III [Parelusimicrobium proximum]|uniref:PAQR family membrane homeostasis protein TrhA n=1 Tax=Parelusimicrobium proximum TaxID=3228953 RepID=UPI003D17CA5D